jgi:hypothetical protein
VPIVRRRLLSRHALQLGSLTISVGASFSSFVVAKPSRQTCFLRPRVCRARQGTAHLTPSLLRSNYGFPTASTPSRRRSVAAPAPPLPTPPRLETPGRSVVGPGTLLPALSLAAAMPAGISTLSHHRCPSSLLVHVIWWLLCPRCRFVVDQRVQHPALFVSYASRDGQHVPRCAAAAAVSAQSKAGQSPSNAAYEEFPHFLGPGPRQSAKAYEETPLLTSSASAPKRTTLPVDLLVHRDAASC